MSVVTRFPPSPTGFMHIGTARVALYNWLYAKHHGGKMLFRIEDTDRTRHSEEAVVALINAMHWLDLDWDGDIVSQFKQRNRHAEVANELVEKGEAYHCYCSPEELEEMREKAKQEGKPTFYDRRWRDSNEAPPEGIKPVIRIKAPLDGETTIHDEVQGDVTVANEQLDDFIILRSDGSPTYMLAVVVDDHDMDVTHVIRGDDHLNNTFRQNLIYHAMKWDIPAFAHLPMILGPDGTKMSKRHGAASIEEYLEKGYLPWALLNYILRLGWSHGDDEIISREQATEWFNLGHVQKSPARFDFDKLENLNSHYITEANSQHILELAKPFYQDRHGIELSEEAEKRIIASSTELQSRAKTLLQFVDESVFYAKSGTLSFDEKAEALLDDGGQEVLSALLAAFEKLSEFSSDTVQGACKSVADELRDGKLGKVAMPLRAALTGTTVSPSIFHAAEILGKEETFARIKSAIEYKKAAQNKDLN